MHDNDSSQDSHGTPRTLRPARIAEVLTPLAADYAQRLYSAGLTIYLHEGDTTRAGALSTFFHYSREVDGQTCYGVFHDGSQSFEGSNHTMPITPSRLNGSGAQIGGWGIDILDPLSVEYALAVARPANYCPDNAEPTPEALEYARRTVGTPERFYRGATLANAKPWGIGTTYVAVSA
jgi:hypothetical protein